MEGEEDEEAVGAVEEEADMAVVDEGVDLLVVAAAVAVAIRFHTIRWDGSSVSFLPRTLELEFPGLVPGRRHFCLL